jgi:hypothetical protein
MRALASGASSVGGRIAIAGNTIGVAPSVASCEAKPAACARDAVTITPMPREGPQRYCHLLAGCAAGRALTREPPSAARARQELVGELASPDLRALDVVHFGVVALAAQDCASARACDQPTQPQRALLPFGRMPRDGAVAAAAEYARERCAPRPCASVVARSASGASAATSSGRSLRHSIASAHCPGAGKLSSGLEHAADSAIQTRALERRRRDDQRVATAGLSSARTRASMFAAQALSRRARGGGSRSCA